MAHFSDETLMASLGEPSSVLGSQDSPPHLSSPTQSIPCAQAPQCSLNHSRSPSRVRKRVRNPDQVRDIVELKGQMAQILEHLSRQQVPTAPPAPAPEHTPASPVVAAEVQQQDVVMSKEEQDAISLAATWDKESFLQAETQDPDLTKVTVPSSELASEPEVPAPSSSVRTLMKRVANFLQLRHQSNWGCFTCARSKRGSMPFGYTPSATDTVS
ncbi:UNVERIFIED_CONTAM: hypothetical protein FKN15_020566 [Acipenser sinensis]